MDGILQSRAHSGPQVRTVNAGCHDIPKFSLSIFVVSPHNNLCSTVLQDAAAAGMSSQCMQRKVQRYVCNVCNVLHEARWREDCGKSAATQYMSVLKCAGAQSDGQQASC